MRTNIASIQWGKLSSTVYSFSTVIAIVVVGGIAVFEYYTHKTDAKKASSLKLVFEYHGEGALKYRHKLDEAWELGYPVLIKTLKGNTDKAKAYNKYVNALIAKKALYTEIDYVMNFYERTVTCVNDNICDEDIVAKFFLNNGRVFIRKYYPYVCSIRQNSNDNSIWSNAEAYFNPEGVGKICSEQKSIFSQNNTTFIPHFTP